ncbi:MAG TPA: hypothetical protein VNI60_04340 [Pyrinomonadaceae bacterium]|nr:hypothetical protein [Pyrinomonadaceae bacterium]
MKKFLALFIIPIITFCLGVSVYRNSTPEVSIETITKHTSFYDGMNVQIKTYAQLESIDEKNLYSGEPFEKYEAWTYLHTEENSINIDNLRNQLKENLSKKHFKRVKVLVKGTIQDNCNKGTTCCFGNSITIKAQEVTQLEPVEDYTLPE